MRQRRGRIAKRWGYKKSAGLKTRHYKGEEKGTTRRGSRMPAVRPRGTMYRALRKKVREKKKSRSLTSVRKQRDRVRDDRRRGARLLGVGAVGTVFFELVVGQQVE